MSVHAGQETIQSKPEWARNVPLFLPGRIIHLKKKKSRGIVSFIITEINLYIYISIYTYRCIHIKYIYIGTMKCTLFEFGRVCFLCKVMLPYVSFHYMA